MPRRRPRRSPMPRGLPMPPMGQPMGRPPMMPPMPGRAPSPMLPPVPTPTPVPSPMVRPTGMGRPPGMASPIAGPSIPGGASDLLRQIVEGINMWRQSWGDVQRFATQEEREPLDTSAMREQVNQIFGLILELIRTPFTDWGGR